MKIRHLFAASIVLASSAAFAETQQDLLLGTWQCVADAPEAKMKIITNDTYNADGTSSSAGEMHLEDMKLQITSTGTWSKAGNTLKGETTSINISSSEQPEFAAFFEKMVKMQDMTSSAKIVTLSEEALVLRELSENTVIRCKK